MCKVHAAVAVALAVGLAVGLAQAPARAQSPGQAQPGANRKYKPQPLNLHKELAAGGAAYAADGRKRMAAGDCEGALTSFDAALRTASDDPTLYRDRGLCHEKLGHPYPAIDDYREYLTDAPSAPDAEGIRTRLTQLEDETSGRAPSSSANDDTDVPPATATASAPPNHRRGSSRRITSLVRAIPSDEDVPCPARCRHRGRGR